MEKIDMIQTADGQQFNFGATGGGVRKIRLDYNIELDTEEIGEDWMKYYPVVEKTYEELGITYEEAIDAIYNKNDIIFEKHVDLLTPQRHMYIDLSNTTLVVIDTESFSEEVLESLIDNSMYSFNPDEYKDCTYFYYQFDSSSSIIPILLGFTETSVKYQFIFAG